MEKSNREQYIQGLGYKQHCIHSVASIAFILLPWISIILVHSFYSVQLQVSRLTFFHQFNFTISISNISSIYVYQQLPLDLALYRDRSGPSCGVRLFEESKTRISKPHRHPLKRHGLAYLKNT